MRFPCLMLLLALCTSLTQAQCPNGPCPDRIQRNGGKCIVTTTGAIDCTAKPGQNITLTTTSGGAINANGNPIITSATTAAPGGVNTNVQFNNSGAFGGHVNFTFDSALSRLTLNGPLRLSSLTASTLCGLDSSKDMECTSSGTDGVIPLWQNTIPNPGGPSSRLTDSRIIQQSGVSFYGTAFSFLSTIIPASNAFASPASVTVRDMSGNGQFINAKAFEFENASTFRGPAGSTGACFDNGVGQINCSPDIGANGKILIGRGGSTPLANNITATSPIVVTNGPGTIALSCPTCGPSGTQTILLMAQGQSGTDLVANNTTLFTYPHNYLSTGALWVGTESTRGYVMPYDGTIDKLVIKTDTAQPGTNTLTVTMRKNGADTALTLTVAPGSAAGFFSDNTHSFTVTAGDRIAFKGANSAGGSNSAVFLLLSVRYQATIP